MTRDGTAVSGSLIQYPREIKLTTMILQR